MKVLLIATNQAERYMDRMVVRPLPIGLAYVAAHIDENRHRIKTLDLMFSEDANADVTRTVESFQPDVVGLSMRNLDNQSYLNTVWHLPGIRKTVESIRAASPAKIVCGGTAFSILPEECLGYLGADMGLAGHATDTFGALVDRMERGDDYSDIPGLVYRKGDEIVRNEIGEASEFHNPPRLDLMDISRYNKAGFGVGVVTKLAPTYYPNRGSSDWNNLEKWRIRPVDEVVSEIADLGEKHEINKVFFIDSGFNIPVEFAKELCQSIVDSGLNVRWNSYIRTGNCDSELFDLMKRSGCSLALIAATGGHDDAGGNKLADHLGRTKELTAACRSAELPYTMSITFGDPGETKESVTRKLDFMREVDPAFATLRAGTRVLPNTALAETARKNGLIDSESDLLKPVFYIEPNVKGWLVEELMQETQRHPRWNLM
jgi:radical SAM superfamily enzyme YgiQ (UPF0313 family)